MKKLQWKLIDETGNRYTRLVVLRQVGKDYEKRAVWECSCDCGKTHRVTGKSLRSGHTKSCGCLHQEFIHCGEARTTHGHTAGGFSREYSSWAGIKDRCLNKKNSGFKNYGARGIKVCDRWKNSFENFFKDMGECPEGRSIERINNDGDYCPENCKWATRFEQNNNTRGNHFLILNGERKTMKQWSISTGICAKLIWNRTHRGWSAHRTLTEKVKGKP